MKTSFTATCNNTGNNEISILSNCNIIVGVGLFRIFSEFYVCMQACRCISMDIIWYGYIFYHTALSFFSRDEQWLQTASHEATYAIVGMMFFHKIHFLQANENHGAIYQSGEKVGDILISLAPYCLLILTCAFLLLRIMGANKMLYVIDLFIGFTLAFHLVC